MNGAAAGPVFAGAGAEAGNQNWSGAGTGIKTDQEQA